MFLNIRLYVRIFGPGHNQSSARHIFSVLFTQDEEIDNGAKTVD